MASTSAPPATRATTREARAARLAEEFAAAPFPVTWRGWPGCTPVDAEALADAGVSTPLALLGAVLLHGPDAGGRLAAAPSRELFARQLAAWREAHGV